MKISANDIRSGNILEYKNELWMVTKNPEHTKPGKGGAYVQVEMKSLKNGNKLNERFNSTTTVEKAFLDHQDFQFLYLEGEFYVFMDNETFEQINVKADLLEDKAAYLTDGMIVEIQLYRGEPINISLPANITLTISETDPVIKGATVTSSYKPAILENGVKVMVPPYITVGEKIVVKTEDSTFVERAK